MCPRGDVASFARALSIQLCSGPVPSVPFLLAYMLPIDSAILEVFGEAWGSVRCASLSELRSGEALASQFEEFLFYVVCCKVVFARQESDAWLVFCLFFGDSTTVSCFFNVSHRLGFLLPRASPLFCSGSFYLLLFYFFLSLLFFSFLSIFFLFN